MRSLTLLLLVLLQVGSGAVLAAEMPSRHVIEVTADAHTEVKADLALLDFGVVTQADSAAEAARQNASRMEVVLAAVRKVAGAEARINTGAYSIRPQYQNRREGGTPRITGYEVSNVLHLRMSAMGRVGDAIDAAIRAGANQVQRLAFALKDESAARNDALRLAVAKAREKTRTIAEALGVRTGAVYSVVEHETGVVRPMMRQAMAMSAESGPSTPVEPGEVEVRARVVLTTEIAGRD